MAMIEFENGQTVAIDEHGPSTVEEMNGTLGEFMFGRDYLLLRFEDAKKALAFVVRSVDPTSEFSLATKGAVCSVVVKGRYLVGALS